MVCFGGHLEHHCTHNCSHWLLFGAWCEEHLGNEALCSSFEDFGIKLFTVVEREPLSLQGLQLLYVGSLVFADGGLGEGRVGGVALEELVNLSE
jgi:hypothetical protein